MMRSIVPIALMFVSSLPFTTGVQAGTPSTKPMASSVTLIATTTAARAAPDGSASITEELRSDDQATIKEAVDQIHELLRTNPQKAVGTLKSTWLKRLMELQRYDDVSDLSLLAILASPSETLGVELLQTFRVQSLLALGKTSDALAAAKQLFDVSSLKGTADAVRTVCQCLNAVHPDDREVLKRYRKEQIDGARTASASASVSPATLTLGAIQIDPAPYQPAIRAITSEDYKSLVGEGNLLLLAGNSKEAWDVFERAYTMATDKDLVAASENLARCMKAQDGTIGRANAWVLSIRPKAQLASDRAASSAFASTQGSPKE